MQDSEGKIVNVGTLEIDRDGHRIYCCNSVIEISALNFKLLLYLLDNANRVCTYDELLIEVWGYKQCGSETHLVILAISRLKKCLRSCQSCHKSSIEIRNVRSIGYCIDI